MSEPCTCGRRMSEPGPWETAENLDEWREGNWDRRDSDTWEWPWQPRTCSFCGCAHPQDVLKLCDEGWEIQPSDKGYKFYLNPPGWAAYRRKRDEEYRRIGEAGRDGSDTAENLAARHQAWLHAERPEDLWSPAPPVKGYIQHFSREEVALLNEKLDEQRRR